MTRDENLLLVAMEECDEVSQNLSKVMRFGAYQRYPLDGETNGYNVMKEFYQLCSMIEMCQERGLLPRFVEELQLHIMDQKQKKVLYFQEASEGLGTVKE